MLHAKIIDIEKNKIKTSEAEAFIKSSYIWSINYFYMEM